MYQGVRRFLCSVEVMLEVVDFFLLRFPKQGVFHLLKYNFVFCCLENLHSAKAKDFLASLFDPGSVKYSFSAQIKHILVEYAHKISLPVFLAKACFKYERLTREQSFIKGFIHPKIERACGLLLDIKDRPINRNPYRHVHRMGFLGGFFFDSFHHETVFGLDPRRRLDGLGRSRADRQSPGSRACRGDTPAPIWVARTRFFRTASTTTRPSGCRASKKKSTS